MTAADRGRDGVPGAVILGGRYSALGIVQSLGSRGIDVHVAHERPGIAGRSKWGRYRNCPNPITDYEGWLARLVGICQELPAPPVILPSADPEAQALARAAPRLGAVARVRTSPTDSVDTVLDKAVFGDWAATHNLSAPPTVRADLFARSRPDLAWPLVAKPRFRSDRATRRSGLIPRFALLESPGQWPAFRHRYSNRLNAIVVQPFIAGTTADMYSAGVCADRGAVRSVFIGRKVRGFPSLYGDTIVGESADLPDQVLEEVRRITHELSLDGLTEFEYKRDPNTGEYYLIELNPRAWSWIAATVAAGSDLPAVAWELASGEPVPGGPRPDERRPVTYARVVPDFFNVCLRYRSDRPEWSRGPIAWWRGLRSSDLLVAETHLGDRRILFWGLVRAVTQELESWPRKPVVRGIAQGTLDLTQATLQALVGWLTPRSSWPRTARTLAQLRARFDSDCAIRSAHVDRVLGGRRLDREPAAIELGRSANTFLDGVAVFRELRPDRWSPQIRVKGQEHVASALEAGCGAILWLANINNSRLMLRRALHAEGWDAWQLSRPSHGFSKTSFGIAVLNPLWRRAEDRYLGKRLLIEGDGDRATLGPLRAMRRRLKDNGVVSITVGDESDDVAFMPFFSGTVPLSTGPAKLAAASGAPLLPVFAAYREGVFEVWIEPKLDGATPGDLLADYGLRLEARVAADPDTHRVWQQALPAEPG